MGHWVFFVSTISGLGNARVTAVWNIMLYWTADNSTQLYSCFHTIYQPGF